MPNWVKNRVRVKNKYDLQKLVSLLLKKDDESGYYSTNFNSIIPMPEELLNIEYSSYEESKKKRKANKEKYGFESWYDFACEKWGCKWDNNKADIIDGVIEFQTPWSIPRGIYEEVSKTIPIFVLYADENIGYNCGALEFVDGEYHEIKIDGTDSQLANAVWGTEYDAESDDGECECYKEESFSDYVVDEINRILYEYSEGEQ